MKLDLKKTIDIRRFALRLVPSFLVVTAVVALAGPFCARTVLPVLSFVIETCNPDYEILEFRFGVWNGEAGITYKVLVDRTAAEKRGSVVRGRDFSVFGGINGATLYVAPIIVFTLLLAWPSLAAIDTAKAFLIAVPLILLIEAIDIPVFIVTLLENDIKSTIGDEYIISSFSGNARIFINHVLNNGGRQFLALLAFTLSIAPFYMASRKPADSPVGKNDPCPCGSGRKYKHCCMKT